MVSKRIVTCWFGDRKKRSDIEEVCLSTLKEVYNDREFVEVNESNFDVNMFTYTATAYHQGYYAFVADIARLWYLYNFGGVYFDTDVYCLKKISDELLQKEMFIGTSINEETYEKTDELVSTGVIGAEKGSRFIKRLLDSFKDEIAIMEEDKMYFMQNISKLISVFISKEELKNLKNSIDFGAVTICPYDYLTCCFWRSKQLIITPRSFSIHLYAGAWTDSKYEEKVKNRILKMFKEIRSYE